MGLWLEFARQETAAARNVMRSARTSEHAIDQGNELRQIQITASTQWITVTHLSIVTATMVFIEALTATPWRYDTVLQTNRPKT